MDIVHRASDLHCQVAVLQDIFGNEKRGCWNCYLGDMFSSIDFIEILTALSVHIIGRKKKSSWDPFLYQKSTVLYCDHELRCRQNRLKQAALDQAVFDSFGPELLQLQARIFAEFISVLIPFFEILLPKMVHQSAKDS